MCSPDRRGALAATQRARAWRASRRRAGRACRARRLRRPRAPPAPAPRGTPPTPPSAPPARTCRARPRRGDEADALAVAVLGGEPLEQRVRIGRVAHGERPDSRSSPTPSKTRTPRAPLQATKLASSSTSSRTSFDAAGVEQVVAVEEVERRLGHPSPRWRRASYSSTAAATLTLSDSTPSASGIATAASQVLRTSGRTPLPSAPKTSATPPVGRRPTSSRRSAAAAYDQRSSRLISAEVAGEVRDDGHRQVLDRARRSAADGRRHRAAPCAGRSRPSRRRRRRSGTTAPRLRGSVTWSRQARSGGSPAASSQGSA